MTGRVPFYWQVGVPEVVEEASWVVEQWAVLYPRVSPVGEIIDWTRASVRNASEAWESVAHSARDGVTARVEMRRITVQADGWSTPAPPQGGTDGP